MTSEHAPLPDGGSEEEPGTQAFLDKLFTIELEIEMFEPGKHEQITALSWHHNWLSSSSHRLPIGEVKDKVRELMDFIEALI